MGKPKRQTRLRPQDMPTPKPEAIGLYFLLRGQGVQIWRVGSSLQVAFPRNEVGHPQTPEPALQEAITRNWLGLFEVVCAIEAKHKAVFAWLAPTPVTADNPFFRTELISEPADAVQRLIASVQDRSR